MRSPYNICRGYKNKKKNEEEGKAKAIIFWEPSTFILRETAKYLHSRKKIERKKERKKIKIYKEGQLTVLNALQKLS